MRALNFLVTTVALCTAKVATQVSYHSQQPFGHATKLPYTVKRQYEDLCRAGSKQWTGTIDVGYSRDLFYCAS